MHVLIHSLEHGIKDTLSLIPFLFVTYLIMESVERTGQEKASEIVAKAGPFGPLLGAIFGVFPQCGFSAAASNFYAAGLVNMGTLIAVFMSTSDEMLPILIAEKVAPVSVIKILLAKILIALFFGYLITCLLIAQIKSLHNSINTNIKRCINKYAENIFIFSKYVIRTSSDNHA